MTDIRRIDIPSKDLPLRADVSLLGSLVGAMLVDQHGQDLLDRVERVRKAAIRQREGSSGEPGLEAALSGMEPRQAVLVIQA
ncbi:MAG: phosphoenolpyruvate carboxylase, partial [Xanthomonadales bacterium]|nr:phosphoenolpyruvate carboxylase [Xanthomonadales bacterium]